jgi:hypothetical protein
MLPGTSHPSRGDGRPPIRAHGTIQITSIDDEQMRHSYEKGTPVNNARRSTEFPLPRFGLRATPRALLRIARSVTVTRRLAKQLRVASAIAAVLVLVLLSPGVASATFTRPFVTQITGTPAGQFANPGGVAVDGTGNLWVAERAFNNKEETFVNLDEFEASGKFVETVKHEGVRELAYRSLAIESANSTGHFYLVPGQSQNLEVFTRTGVLVKRQEVNQNDNNMHVAIDNSPSAEALDPSRCTLSSCTAYVSIDESTVGSPPQGIEKFEVNAAGEVTAAPFTASAGYIKGDRIIGTPGGTFSEHQMPGDVAVDSHGNIYVIGETANNLATLGVYEYEPSGKFVQAFTSAETPGVGESKEEAGWGGRLQGIAIDPVSEHLLVSVYHAKSEGEGAVDEFDSGTGKFLEQVTATDPKQAGAHLHDPREMTVDSHGDLFVVDSTESYESNKVHVVDVYGPPGLHKPSVKIGEASERTPSGAVVDGAVDPEGQPLGACRFEYVEQSVFEGEGFAKPEVRECEPSAAQISKEADLETFYPVKAALTGLRSGTTYRYRLVAKTEGGGEAASEALAFTAPAVPRIESASASGLSSTFVDLHATIDPLGADTVYHFEYLTVAAYQADGESFTGPERAVSVPVSAADIGAGGMTGSVSVAVVQQARGLVPATAYRFRVVASNAFGAVEGGEHGEGEFTTLPAVSPGLPDGRAYELVTPPGKGSAGDMFGPFGTLSKFGDNEEGYVSESGDEFLLKTTVAFGPFPASGQNAYVFSRTPQGWRYTSLASPALGVQSVFPLAFDPANLSRFGIEDGIGSSQSTLGLSWSSLVGTPGGPYVDLHADAPVHFGERGEEETTIMGASRDLSHVIVASKNHTLAPGAETQDRGSRALYESAGTGECTTESGNCTVIDLEPSTGKVFPCGAVLGLGDKSLGDLEPQPSQGNGLGGTSGKTHDAVSADGSRVFFTAPDPNAVNGGPGCWDGASVASANAPQLYMRTEGKTTEVSAPAPGAPEAGGDLIAQFVGASEDGSRVFFVTEMELTADDAGIHDYELYEYDALRPESERLKRISTGEPGTPAVTAGAGVLAVPQVSADGSAVYFLAQGQLTAGHPAAPGGMVNLYRYDTTAASTVYVATVSQLDWTTTDEGNEGSYGRGSDPREDWYSTPDGHYLLFLTGGRLYRYQAPNVELPAGSLECVSCGPGGVAGGPEFARSALAIHDTGAVRGLSNDGSYAFFDTAQALVPQDTNSTLDVYEWQAPGTHGCALTHGCVHLLSSGVDPAPSYFLGASPDGANVFIGTHARLVPADTDAAGDLYDVRICTTQEPCIKATAGETAQCEGGACQSPPPSLQAPTLATLTFAGSGNITPEPSVTKKVTTKTVKCKKGLVKKKIKKKERCVKKPKSKKRAKKASHSGRGK